MRPDRIVVGECRGPEALDMLQAMNTGHDGSLTTIHANNSSDVILRLEVLVQMAADLPVDSIRHQIASAVDVIVQLKRMRDGRRCLSQITEVAGINPITGKLEMRDLFLLDDPETGQPQLQPTGRLPTFIDELISTGMLNLQDVLRRPSHGGLDQSIASSIALPFASPPWPPSSLSSTLVFVAVFLACQFGRRRVGRCHRAVRGRHHARSSIRCRSITASSPSTCGFGASRSWRRSLSWRLSCGCRRWRSRPFTWFTFRPASFWIS